MRRNQVDLSDDEQQTGRWLISYADLMTLLFAFFVVMYSISQVSESKYKILSESLTQAFDTMPTSLNPIQVGEIATQPLANDKDPIEAAIEEGDDLINETAPNQEESFASSEEFKSLENGLRSSLSDLISQDLAKIESDANWININLRSALLFTSGEAELNTGADPLLEEVSKHLNSNTQLILVHGHTDNVPIETEQFPSNWELSAARAVAVVRKLQNLAVYAPRMSVEGHGEFQPVASNDTAEGRAKNRRVVISISRKQRVEDKELKIKENIAESVNTAESNTQAGATTAGSQASSVKTKEAEPQFNIVRLPGGGILIRGKDLPESGQGNQQNGQGNGQNNESDDDN